MFTWGDSQYRLVYCIYVEHKESGISVYRDKDFDVQEVINRLPSKFTIEKEQELLPKGVNIKIHKYSINCAVSLFSNAADYFKDHTVNSTSETRGLLFSYEEYPILDTDTTKVVDGKYPLDYATEIIESNLDDIIDYIVQSGTETYNDRTSRGFGNRWSPYNEEERKQVIKLFNSGTWYDTLGSLKHLYYERTPKA